MTEQATVTDSRYDTDLLIDEDERRHGGPIYRPSQQQITDDELAAMTASLLRGPVSWRAKILAFTRLQSIV